MKEIETERLILRHIMQNDAEDIFEYSKNPNVGINAGWEPHKNMDATRKVMDELFLGKENIFGIILKDSGKLIGSIGIQEDPMRENPHAQMLGYAMSETYWGHGFMTEAAQIVVKNAFNELPIALLSCTCYTDNIRSRRVIEKCGFQYEGCLRKCEERFDGEIMDVYCFSMLK